MSLDNVGCNAEARWHCWRGGELQALRLDESEPNLDLEACPSGILPTPECHITFSLFFFFNKESGRSQLLPGCILCFLEELSRKAKLSVWERTQASEFGWHGSKLWPCHLLGVWPREHIALRASKKTQIIIPTHRMQIKWENSEFPTRLWALFSQCWTHVLLYCKSNINVYLLCLQSYRSLFTEWLPCRGQC